MSTLIVLFLFTLNIHIEQAVEGLTLTLIGADGAAVREIVASKVGEYSVDDLEPGVYTLQAVVEQMTVLTIDGIVVPSDEPLNVKIAPEALTQAAGARTQQLGAQKNENIQINRVDNQALNEQLGREGVTAQVIREFTAVRGDYAVEFGGINRNIDIVSSSTRPKLSGEVYGNHQNGVFNARTFFQVGDVLPSRRNQYGFNIGGPLIENRMWFQVTGEEIRQSGFVNGNVLVPGPDERVPRTSDPAAYALIAGWLENYPKELPNRTEIDPRMINTNAPQVIRTSGGSGRLDWEPVTNGRLTIRYSFQDTFIDSFEFVRGRNPNQRLRPQTLNLSFTHQVSDRTTLRFGTNYLRQKTHLLVPPGVDGSNVMFSRQIEQVGPDTSVPLYRVRNDFEYLAHATHAGGNHQFDWGAEIRRYQLNDLQSDESRGSLSFNPNFGRTGIENFLLGIPSHYRVTLGNPYRGFRNTDINLFFNDRLQIARNLRISYGLRYEYLGAPSEVNNLTRIPYRSDRNNFAPRFGFAYSAGQTTFRGGYGIAIGRIFPATFQWARFNPPEIIRVNVQSPDMLDPLKDYRASTGTPRSGLNILAADLVAPYSQHYSFEVERALPADIRIAASYIGSRTLKLFQLDAQNRAQRVPGIPLTTATIDDRRPDQRYFGISRMTNMGRSYFDAGQLTVEKNAGNGLAFRATYTWSKAIDTGTDFSTTATTNREEQRSQQADSILEDLRALSRFDTPHSLVLIHSYRLPGRWFGGFILSGSILFRSGTPFSVETGTDSPPWGNVDGERQDRPSILDPSLSGRSVDNPNTSTSILL